jgi:hypothetical protein
LLPASWRLRPALTLPRCRRRWASPRCFHATSPQPCALAIWSGRFSLPAPLRTQQALAQGLDYRGPDKAPPSWRQFAKLVQYRFETWIGADEEIANRLRAYLIDRAGKEDEPPPTLAVRAWLNPDGTVERVSFDALKDARADADLRTILKHGNVGEAPPPEMLRPLILRFSLNPKKITLRRERRQARRSAKYFTRVDVKHGGISGGCAEGLFERVYRELLGAS